MITSRELLDTSIAQLRTLARFLAEQLGEGREGPDPTAAETRACLEVLRSLSALIVRLQAVGHRSDGDIDLPELLSQCHGVLPRETRLYSLNE
jgi:hypothetical protein